MLVYIQTRTLQHAAQQTNGMGYLQLSYSSLMLCPLLGTQFPGLSMLGALALRVQGGCFTRLRMGIAICTSSLYSLRGAPSPLHHEPQHVPFAAVTGQEY